MSKLHTLSGKTASSTYQGLVQIKNDNLYDGLGNRVRLTKKNIVERNYVTDNMWVNRKPAVDNGWHSVCWSPELGKFCAVSNTGTVSNRVMLSSDGVKWTSGVSVSDAFWVNVCWSPELSLFCAVASSSGSTSSVTIQTSSDGVTWTGQTGPLNFWYSVCWSPELNLFCAVGATGTGNRVTTSSDGVNWISRTSAADNDWRQVCWSPELNLFCAVSDSGTGNRVMTSPDGISWSGRTSAADNGWFGLCWSPDLNLFCAVAYSGTGNRVMTSPDGIVWSLQDTTGKDNNWEDVCWSPELGLFAASSAVSGTNRLMTSPDGVNWTLGNIIADNNWYGICWSPELGIFCAVGTSGTGNRVMTSPKLEYPEQGICVLSSGQTVTSTSLVDINYELSFLVASGTTYYFKFAFNYLPATSAVGSWFAVNSTATVTSLYYTLKSPSNSTVLFVGNYSTVNAGSASSATHSTTTSNIATLEGYITVSTSGRFIGRVASETTAGITLREGSVLFFNKIL